MPTAAGTPTGRLFFCPTDISHIYERIHIVSEEARHARSASLRARSAGPTKPNTRPYTDRPCVTLGHFVYSFGLTSPLTTPGVESIQGRSVSGGIGFGVIWQRCSNRGVRRGVPANVSLICHEPPMEVWHEASESTGSWCLFPRIIFCLRCGAASAGYGFAAGHDLGPKRRRDRGREDQAHEHEHEHFPHGD